MMEKAGAKPLKGVYRSSAWRRERGINIMNNRTLRRWIIVGGPLCALLLAAWATPTLARTKRDFSRVDLEVRPADLKPTPRPPVPRRIEPIADEEPQIAIIDQLEAMDSRRRGEIPDRRRVQNELGLGGEGSFLHELLEDQRITFFRVRLEPPF